jgi:hypothetical protein
MSINGESTAPTTETGKSFWALIEQYWRQGATAAQAIQAAREAAYEANS